MAGYGPRAKQKRDENEADLIAEVRFGYKIQLMLWMVSLFRKDYIVDIGPLPDFISQDTTAGFDLLTIYNKIFVVEVKNPETGKLKRKNGDITKALTDNETKTRRQILAAGGNYYVILYTNDLLYVLGLPLQPDQPISSLICKLKDPCICSKCGATSDKQSYGYIPDFDSCASCYYVHPGIAQRPILKHHWIDDTPEPEPLVW